MGEKGSLKAYHRKLGEYPLKVTGKLSADEKACDELAKYIPKANPRDPTVNDWIQAETWSLMYEQARLRQNGKLGNGMARGRSRGRSRLP